MKGVQTFSCKEHKGEWPLWLADGLNRSRNVDECCKRSTGHCLIGSALHSPLKKKKTGSPGKTCSSALFSHWSLLCCSHRPIVACLGFVNALSPSNINPRPPHRTASVCYLEMAKRKHNCPRRKVTENVKKKKMKEKTTKVRIEADAKTDKKPTTWQLFKKLCTRLNNPTFIVSILGQLAIWVLGGVYYEQQQKTPTCLPCPCISTLSPSPSTSPST